MKGKGIQITNKAYRDGYERTFKKDSEIPFILDSLEKINPYARKGTETPKPIKNSPLMESWILDINHSEGLHDDYLDQAIFHTQDEGK